MPATIAIQSIYEKITTVLHEHEVKRKDEQALINQLLDGINAYRKLIKASTAQIEEMVALYEQLTWINHDELTEADYHNIKDIIAASKLLKSRLLRSYADSKSIRDKGLAKAELKEFKATILDYQEAYEDMEMIFFRLPQDEEFQQIMQQIETLD